MSRPSTTCRSIAVLTALTATLAFSPASAGVRQDARVPAPTVINDQQSQDSDAVTSHFDARSMRIAPQADRGRKVQVAMGGPDLTVGPRLNLIDVTILSGDRSEGWRAMWLFPRDGDDIASLRLWDITEVDDAHPYGKRVPCPGLDGRFLDGRNARSIQLTVPRACIADPARIRVNGKLWDITRYNRNTGFPRQGHYDAIPRGRGFTDAL